jgi:hypothetical protein
MSEPSINSRFTTKNFKIIVSGSTVYGPRRQVLPRFEPDSFAGRNRYLGAGPRISPHAAFTGLNYKNAEPAKLDAFTKSEGVFHRIEQRIHHLLRFLFWYTRFISNKIDDVQFDHHFLLVPRNVEGEKTVTRLY